MFLLLKHNVSACTTGPCHALVQQCGSGHRCQAASPGPHALLGAVVWCQWPPWLYALTSPAATPRPLCCQGTHYGQLKYSSHHPLPWSVYVKDIPDHYNSQWPSLKYWDFSRSLCWSMMNLLGVFIAISSLWLCGPKWPVRRCNGIQSAKACICWLRLAWLPCTDYCITGLSWLQCTYYRDAVVTMHRLLYYWDVMVTVYRLLRCHGYHVRTTLWLGYHSNIAIVTIYNKILYAWNITLTKR